jgi:hypothetical protein
MNASYRVLMEPLFMAPIELYPGLFHNLLTYKAQEIF